MSHTTIHPNDTTELDLTYDITPRPYHVVMLEYCDLLAKTHRHDWETGLQTLSELPAAQQELAELLLVSELYHLIGMAIPQPGRRLVCQRFMKCLRIISEQLQYPQHRQQIMATVSWFEGHAKGSTEIFPQPEPATKQILNFTTYLTDKPLARWQFGEKIWLELNPDFNRQNHQLLETLMLRRLERQILNVELPAGERYTASERLRQDLIQLQAWRVRYPTNHLACKKIIAWLERYHDNRLIFQPTSSCS